ncbi:sensor domain-containing diguanylate cyclase [Oceanibaculum pacificum]|uniref:diguanylate cyclase n=1 Tax=Oceanibaculum pacificum TaxID=580166 RepID=A0A154WGK5_9PROT|nr:sensor domain-containing diguanylate cyclase [Oceanibaculum pacificum]KZD12629.1 hypothetical protein AUP43_15875 [Oceanibaculum pacificum]
MKSNLFIDRMTLRLQLGIAIGVLTAALVLACAMIAGSLATRTMEGMVSRDLEARAGAMQEMLDRGMFERFHDIINAASLQTALSGELGVAPLRTVIERLHKTYPLYAWIGVMRPDGLVLAATDDLLVNANAGHREWFQAALRGPHVGDVHDAFMLAKYLPSTGPEPLRFVDVAAPIHGDDHKVIGVLGAHLSWEWAGEQVGAILSAEDRRLGRTLTVLNRDGKVILGGPFGQDMSHLPAVRAAMQGKNGYFREMLDGVDTSLAVRPTTGYRDYKGLGWIVVASQPAETALRQVEDLQHLISGVGLAMALVAALLGWLVAQRLALPLQKLQETAKLLGVDPKESNLPRLFGSRELVDLSHALRALVRRLRQAEGAVHQLETSVEKRVELMTAELQETNRSLTELAERDPLSGLLNRRGLEARGARLFASAKLDGMALSVLLLDIDRFKQVNDTYGHASGDTVLQTVSWICLAEARSQDLVCRLGGEEIVVVTRGDMTGAMKLAERLRLRVADTPVATYGETIQITVSIGCAGLAEQDRNVMSVINRADQALYLAKRRGRNMVVPYEDEAGTLSSVG